MDLVEKIQSLCEQKNTTIAQLERDLDFSKGSIRKWGASSPSSDKLLKVARYFDVSMEALLESSNVQTSIPYRFINKMISVTTSNLLEWHSFTELDNDPDFNNHPNAADIFHLGDFSEFQGDNFQFNRSDAFYAYYKNGGYTVIKIEDTNKNDSVYALFILCNENYFLYASDKNLSLVQTLFEAAKTKATGVDDFINEFLNDNFGFEEIPSDDDLPF